ncbi:MAG TPA: hypothetical protein VIY51_06435 [Xanthobacteraceae bacterium]
MTATRLWMFACFAFAGLSAYLAIQTAELALTKSGGDIRFGFVQSERDTMFKLVAALQPPLQADQLEAAAKAAALPVEKMPRKLVIFGVEFTLAGTGVSYVRSDNL